ncbi:MAG: preprotein translocase subunit YajC [Gemella haemolysans]|uniref:Preprotein translocase, YajC subunit n=1 Tax=Gemella haemolysans TaxID=1379 RepID=A0A134A2P1_9BACL|nr:preprotein translocase subunit YajC [Gemella haemolysans]TKW64591.1 MAG: preprotein translocase subunit YajC [Gemella sp.]KXB61965.1 preprotein translocase, YajC subunit [Gemella haemolysans]MBS5318224.1 preprotein translocase subunit YajC [Gemella haemolysans]MDU3830917.1 preprotein translocase subunit YajC [Gemella haemolysans]MDU6766587.1 preprotein translocase subunit YajC [Gemella haemolysans]
MQYSYINIIMIVVLFAFMYFMIIRPQSKRNKELKLLQDSLKEGDRIVTFAGIYGDIVEVGTVTVKVRIAPKVEIELDRNSIRSLVAK